MKHSPDHDSSSPHETIDLVRQAADGDVDAWQVLDDGHRAAVATIVRRRLPAKFRGRFDTEDIVQSALMDAFQGLSKFDDQGERSFRSWLSRIVLNKLYERLRYHRRDRRSVERDYSPVGSAYLDIITDKTSEAELQEIADQHAFVVEKIQGLPEAERDAVTLHLIEGRSHAQVSEELGLSVSVARKHCSSGVARLLQWASDE